MRTASPGNRLLVGESGIVFEVPDSVASGLVGNKTARYVGEAVSAPPAPPRPVPAEQPKRRGRPPKAAAAAEDDADQ